MTRWLPVSATASRWPEEEMAKGQYRVLSVPKKVSKFSLLVAKLGLPSRLVAQAPDWVEGGIIAPVEGVGIGAETKLVGPVGRFVGLAHHYLGRFGQCIGSVEPEQHPVVLHIGNAQRTRRAGLDRIGPDRVFGFI